MEPLEYEHPSLFRFEEVPEAAFLDPFEAGIRISARGVRHDGEALRFELLITYSFASSFLDGFQSITQGFSCALEDAASGRIAVLRTLDPHKKYPRMNGPNFLAPERSEAAPGDFEMGWVSVPLEIPLHPPGAMGPGLFVTVFLQHHVSNTLAFNLKTGECESFLGGRPFHVITAEAAERHEASDDSRPLPGGATLPALGRLELSAREQGPFAPGKAVHLEAVLTLEREALEAVGAEGWLRSLFVCATRQDNQASQAGNWLGERLVYPDDVRMRTVDGREVAEVRASFELAEVIGARLRRGLHYVQASARQFRSNVLEIPCG